MEDAWLQALKRTVARVDIPAPLASGSQPVSTWVPNGTAFLVDAHHVVTALHVLGGQRGVRLMFTEWQDDQERKAELEWPHPLGCDLAVLRLDRPCDIQPHALGTIPKPGSRWSCFGYPRGVPGGHTLYNEEIKDPQKLVLQWGIRILQLDTAKAQEELGGFSGAPCVVDGLIVGVVTYQLRRNSPQVLSEAQQTKVAPSLHTLYALPIQLLTGSPVTPVIVEPSLPAPRQEEPEVPFTHYLPDVPEFFKGREEDTRRVIDALRSSPVVVISAMAGQGKSTLAAHVVTRLAPQFQRILWVPCESERTTLSEIIGLIVRQLPPKIGWQLKSTQDENQQLEYLAQGLAREGRVLLVLDSISSPPLAAQLVRAASRCSILMTTRRVLDAPRATEIKLGKLSDSAGMQMLQQISSCEMSPALVNLVRSLGGLPLAIKMAGQAMFHMKWDAGAFLEAFEKSETLDWLAGTDDTPVVRKAFETSYRQLSPEAQSTFRLLGTFEGGLVSTQMVVHAAGRDPLEIHRHRLTLVLLGLIEVANADFIRVHPLIARYAHELLAKDPQRAAAHERCAHIHKARLSNWDAAAGCFRHTEGQPSDVEHATEAARHFIRAGNPLAAQEVLVGTADIISRQGRRMLLYRLIDWASTEAQTIEPWLEIYRSGSVLNRLVHADVNRARRALEELGARVADPKIASAALIALAKEAIVAEEFAKASDLLSRAIEFKQVLNDERGITYILNEQGRIASKSGDNRRALQLHEQALEIQERIKDDEGAAYSLRRMASLHLHSGNDAEKALALLRRAEGLSRKSRRVLIKILLEIAEACRKLKKEAAAAASLERAYALANDSDDWYTEFHTLQRRARAFEKQGYLRRALALTLRQELFKDRCSTKERRDLEERLHRLKSSVREHEEKMTALEAKLAQLYRAREQRGFMPLEEFSAFKRERLRLKREIESLRSHALQNTSEADAEGGAEDAM